MLNLQTIKVLPRFTQDFKKTYFADHSMMTVSTKNEELLATPFA